MLIIKGETVIPADGKAMLDETTLYVEGARTVAPCRWGAGLA